MYFHFDTSGSALIKCFRSIPFELNIGMQFIACLQNRHTLSMEKRIMKTTCHGPIMRPIHQILTGIGGSLFNSDPFSTKSCFILWMNGAISVGYTTSSIIYLRTWSCCSSPAYFPLSIKVFEASFLPLLLWNSVLFSLKTPHLSPIFHSNFEIMYFLLSLLL